MPRTPVKVSQKDRSAFFEELISFIQDKGYVWGPSPEIYGGCSGLYTYGPMGKLLKHKLENNVRKVFQKHGFWEVECPMVVPDRVWEASGHLGTFVDRVVKCSECEASFRADKLIEEHHDVSADSFKDRELLDFITKHKISCPNCKGSFTSAIEKHNLMLKTTVGGESASLRPETATVTYLPFKRYYEFFRKKLPIAVFQIGKAFRNEISPRQHVIRGREFTQAEGQIFVDPLMKNDWPLFSGVKNNKLPLLTHEGKTENISLEDALKKKYLTSEAYAWCLYVAFEQFISMGVPEDRIRIRQHAPDERAFYAQDAWDIEVNLNSFGWVEMVGVHDRGDYDLKQHAKHSKTTLEADGEKGKVVPHVLEIAFGIDRPLFSLLDVFYKKHEKENAKTMFKVPYHLAPIDVAIFPLMKKDKMPDLALEVKEELEKHFVVQYDVSGSIGRRYLRAAQQGVPYCITIDYDSLDNKDVTLRDRDSEKQVRVKIDTLADTLRNLLNGSISFKSL